MDQEFLDLVDDQDIVIGRKLRSDVYKERLSNFRVVNAFIINSKGQLWIPRRSQNKKLSPLCLDMSMGGHVESGETYEQALKRELLEELNLSLDDCSWRTLGHLTPHRDFVGAFMMVYEITFDQSPRFSPEEFVEYFWLTPEELMAKIEANEQVKSDLPILIRKFYLCG